METNRILHASLGWLTALLLLSGARGQEPPADTIRREQPPPVDTIRFVPPTDDDLELASDTLTPLLPAIDTTAAGIDTAAAMEMTIIADMLSESIYQKRQYVSRGTSDEIRNLPGVFVGQSGPVGSPAVPFNYLNVIGAQVTLNDLPYPYNGIYRPYVIGVDLNTIPWEILQGIEAEPYRPGAAGINFIVGPPADRINRSDVEVARGPYGYQSSRWRFFRPFGNKTYAYFTVGFKRSDGFISITDYRDHHAAGGIRRQALGGEISLDMWNHRARAGVNTFDFLTPQLSRHSREIKRAELRFKRPLGRRHLDAVGLFHRTAQTITGYTSPLKTKYDIGGGKVTLTDSLGSGTIDFGAEYYRSFLYGLAGNRPSLGQFELQSRAQGVIGPALYDLKIAYDWNEADKGAVLPSARIKMALSDRIGPYISASRSRRLPDLYARNIEDNVPNLGIAGFLASYQFVRNSNLATPLVTQGTLGMDFGGEIMEAEIGLSYKTIDSQVRIEYIEGPSDQLTLTPVNFDDQYTEIFAGFSSTYGVFAGELAASYRVWDDKYFLGGFEKGPSAMGYGRISLLKEIFIPQLFLGGSFEACLASRREYRSITAGYTDAFVATFGRLEFRYKDFTFWVNEDNLLNSHYISWWPYYQSPRQVWWGFRWIFFD